MKISSILQSARRPACFCPRLYPRIPNRFKTLDVEPVKHLLLQSTNHELFPSKYLHTLFVILLPPGLQPPRRLMACTLDKYQLSRDKVLPWPFHSSFSPLFDCFVIFPASDLRCLVLLVKQFLVAGFTKNSCLWVIAIYDLRHYFDSNNNHFVSNHITDLQ